MNLPKPDLPDPEEYAEHAGANSEVMERIDMRNMKISQEYPTRDEE
jgi:hypothetical protein